MSEKNKGLIHIYTGDGKGKTTASVGLCIRQAGSGGKVIFVQFLKDNESSELKVLESVEGIRWIPAKKVFGFYFNMNEEEKLEAKEVYSRHLKTAIEEAKIGPCRLLVLDEIIAAYNLGVVDQNYLLDFLKNKPDHLEVVLTGRDPAEELLKVADYISEIRKVKHPFDQGITARVGIEK